MADEGSGEVEAPRKPLRRKPWWDSHSILGIIHPGNRGSDKVLKTIVSAGFAGAAFLLVMHAWREDRIAERKARHEQHVEMVQVMRDQHKEDVDERRRDRCVNAQLTDTVRAAIWKEKPRTREECE